MQAQLPPRFRPKLHQGHSIAGICLIRLDSVRPRFVPQGGIELRTHGLSVEPLQVEKVHSTYFSDEARFLAGSVDCALVMRNLGHEWDRAQDLYV
jgi:hypothetical protein